MSTSDHVSASLLMRERVRHLKLVRRTSRQWGVALVSVENDSGRDPRRGEDPVRVTDVTDDALEDSSDLAWASAGLWTDISIHSRPDTVPLTISTLKQALDDEQIARRATVAKVRSGSITFLVASSGAIAATIGSILSVHETTHRSVLFLVAAGLLGISAVAIGAVSSARIGIKAEKRDIDVTRSLLRREIQHHERLAEAARSHDT
jgi:hypothetical protein